MLIRGILIGAVLSVTVLVDSWVSEATLHVSRGGSTPFGTGGTPEVAVRRSLSFRPDVDLEKGSQPPLRVVLPKVPSVEPERRLDDGICAEPVGPSGRLGRRHLRSPT
jgi:hypothetical protein